MDGLLLSPTEFTCSTAKKEKKNLHCSPSNPMSILHHFWPSTKAHNCIHYNSGGILMSETCHVKRQVRLPLRKKGHCYFFLHSRATRILRDITTTLKNVCLTTTSQRQIEKIKKKKQHWLVPSLEF